MLSRMRGIKRKLSHFADEETRLYGQTEARVAHLAELGGMHTLDDVKYEAWSRRRLDRLLVDYLLRNGYSRSAAALADGRGIGDLVDVETFVQMSRIQDSLRGGSVTEALAWCNENKKELRKMDVSCPPSPENTVCRFTSRPVLLTTDLPPNAFCRAISSSCFATSSTSNLCAPSPRPNSSRPSPTPRST